MCLRIVRCRGVANERVFVVAETKETRKIDFIDKTRDFVLADQLTVSLGCRFAPPRCASAIFTRRRIHDTYVQHASCEAKRVREKPRDQKYSTARARLTNDPLAKYKLLFAAAIFLPEINVSQKARKARVCLLISP